MIAVTPELDLIAWLDPELYAQLLGNDDLPLRSDSPSHTVEYNFWKPSHPMCRWAC